MNGPSAGYLADVWAPFAAGEKLAGVGAPSPVPMPSGQPLTSAPPMTSTGGYPALTDIASAPTPGPIPSASPPPPAGMSSPFEDPNALVSRAPPMSSQAPPAPMRVGAEPGPAPPPMPGPGPDPNAFPLVSVSGGSTPAHEIERRGPSLLAAQGARNDTSENTIGRVAGRNDETAANEYNMALDQERMWRARDAAAQQAGLEQQEELAQRQQDFDGTVSKMGKLGTTDHGRFWASRSTPQKIAGFVELMISGFRGTPSMLMKHIDDDVKAQEFSYYATRDTAQAKQTAFSLAMSKYQNADAARAAARAAAVDATQAQFAQIAAKWKGTEAANRADISMAALQDEKMSQIANGIQFVQPQAAQRRFVDPSTGIVYSNAEAMALQKGLQQHAHEDRSQTAGIGGQLVIQDAKDQTELAKATQSVQSKAQEHAVVLPSGETVLAPNANEEKELRDLSTSASSIKRLVNEAKDIRSNSITGVPMTPDTRGRLNQIQKDLITNFAVQNKLGALSSSDMDLAVGGTADLFNFGNGVEARLDRLNESAINKVSTRVATYPGASPRAAGKMPASFKTQGSK